MVWISLTEKVRVLIWVVEGRHTVHVLKWVVGVALGACYVALALILGGKVHMTLMAGRWAKAIRNTTRTALFPFPQRQVSWISVIPSREQSWRIHPLRTALLLLQVKQIHRSVAGSRIVTILHFTILIRKPMTISTKRVNKIVRQQWKLRPRLTPEPLLPLLLAPLLILLFLLLLVLLVSLAHARLLPLQIGSAVRVLRFCNVSVISFSFRRRICNFTLLIPLGVTHVIVTWECLVVALARQGGHEASIVRCVQHLRDWYTAQSCQVRIRLSETDIRLVGNLTVVQV